MSHIVIRSLVVLVALLGWVSSATAQNYPFFVQPLSVEDLDVLADAVEFSPEQRLELLNAHGVYLDELEALQNGRMQRFIDKGIDMVSEFQIWAGIVEFPPRRDLEHLIREARSLFVAFGELDEAFFEGVSGMVSEAQASRLELARLTRAVDRLRPIYLVMAGEINGPAGIHLVGYLRAADVDLTSEMINVLLDHQERLNSAIKAYERSIFTAIDAVLDKIDDMGLRDMDQQQMLALFMDEGQIAELGLFFDEVSKPVQASAAVLATENVRAWRELEPLLGQDDRFDVNRRVIKKAWRRLRSKVYSQDDRFTVVLDLLPKDDPRRGDALGGRERLRSGFGSLVTEYIPLKAKQDRYRTFDMLKNSLTLTGQDRIDAIMERRTVLVEQAEALLTVLEADLPQQEDEAQGTAKAEAGGEGEGPQAKLEAAMADLPLQPLDPERLQQMLLWADTPDDAVALVGVLHMDYMASIEAMAKENQTAKKAIAEAKTEADWRERRRARRAQREVAMDTMRSHEDILFENLELSIADGVARDRLARIRSAVERSRRRQAMAREDWSMRSQSESVIDLTVMVLSQSPSDLSPEARAAVLEQLLAYDHRVEGTLDALDDMLGRAQLLESRMYGKEAAKMDPEIQVKVRESWRKRRAEVGELTGELATLNREGSTDIAAAMGPIEGETLLETYRQAAYPDLFKDKDDVKEAFASALSIETLGDEQRRKVEDLRLRHSSNWSRLTDELISLRSDTAVRKNAWPPNRESLTLALRNEQLRFRRGQVASRSLAELSVLLNDDQRGQVPALQGKL